MPPKPAAKGKDDKKKDVPPRPTRCGKDFKWEPKPKLIEAVIAGDYERCRKLIARGENVNEALHVAIGRGKLRIVNLLIESGADLFTEVKPGDYWVPPPRPPTPPVEKKSPKKKKKKA